MRTQATPPETGPIAVDRLVADNAELRARLEEAEETILAIRNGRVDAVVVEGPDRPRVYTLESADRPYRLFVEQMQQGAATLHSDGTIAYCNKRFAELLGTPQNQLIGAALNDFIVPRDRAVYENLIWQGRTRSGQGQAYLRRGDGSEVPAYLTFNVLSEDCGAMIGVLVTDLTAQKHHEQLTAAHFALRETEVRLAAELFAMQQLQEISTRLMQDDDLEALYAQILDAAVAIMRSDGASMQIVDESQDALRMLAWRGFEPEFGRVFELNRADTRTSCSVARREGRRVVVTDVETCDFLVGRAELDSHRATGIRAVQSTPLVSRVDGRVIGMISTHWRQPHVPDELKLRLLDVLARQAADLIERKQTDEMRARLAAIIESSDDAIVSKNLDGVITSWNAGAERIFGYKAHEIVGKPITVLIPEDRLSDEEIVLSHIRRAERVEHYETVRRRKDGALIDVSLTVSPVVNPRGQVVGASKIARDITDRKRAEKVLREKEQRFREMIDALPAAVYTTDAEGRLTHFNPAAVEMSGRIPELGTDQWCVTWKMYNTDGTPLPHDRCPMAVAIKEGRILRGVEIVVERPDGKRAWLTPYPTPLWNEQGDLIGGINMAVDITERKEAEKALREKEQRFRAMIDALPAAVYTTDAEGRLTHFNPAAVEMSGRTPELGNDQWCVTWKLYNPDGTPLPHDKCPMAISLKEGKAVRGVEAIAERPDGSRVWFAPYPTPLFDETGELVGGINMLVDITERKQAEHALQEADRRKNEFLATLAHELRNPLNPIRNAVESLRIKGPPEPELEQLRNIIDRQVRHLTRLVDDLLDINRIARDQIDLHKQAVELTDIVNAAVEMSRPLIDQSGHELSLRLPDDPVWLDGDPARLAQVLMNLLNNAAKYTEPGGQIWLDADRQDGQVAIRVTDTGIGIAPDKLGNLFDLFYQADRSMERSGGGLGIGLALVQRFVEMHGGAVTAHSEGPGMGSQFVVRLPVLAERPATASSSDSQPDRIAVSRRILVVDDNQDSAKMLATLLRLTGNEVEMAFDGVEALQTGERFGPEVVLLDIGMPRLNGYETCRRMRQQPWGKEALLIAQTGWGQNEDKRRTAEAGFNAHFVKPISLAALNKLLADWQPTPM